MHVLGTQQRLWELSGHEGLNEEHRGSSPQGALSSFSAPGLIADSVKVFHVLEESLPVLRFLSHPEKDDGTQNLPRFLAVQSSVIPESHCP